MLRFQNKKVALHYGKQPRYEIFWVSQYAEHVVKREKDPSHLISIMEIEALASNAATRFVDFDETGQGGKFVIGFARHRKKLYQILCYFVERPKRRCVIKTCHLVHDIDLIKLCKQLEIQTLP